MMGKVLVLYNDIPTKSYIVLATRAETYCGNPVKNAWKINNEKKNKWYILYSKDRSVKNAWMDAFVRERQRVRDDETSSKQMFVFCKSLVFWLIVVY